MQPLRKKLRKSVTLLLLLQFLFFNNVCSVEIITPDHFSLFNSKMAVNKNEMYVN